MASHNNAHPDGCNWDSIRGPLYFAILINFDNPSYVQNYPQQVLITYNYFKHWIGQFQNQTQNAPLKKINKLCHIKTLKKKKKKTNK